MSFGQISFMCIGAYTTAWATLDPNWKQIMLQGLPHFEHAIYPFPVPMLMGATLAATVALVFGFPVMRLSGIAAIPLLPSAFLVAINSVYSNW